MHRQPNQRTNPQTLATAKAMRRSQTPAEQILWARLRRSQLCGLRFKRQHPIGPYIADFCCASRKVVVEIDGETHLDDTPRDAARTRWLEMRGYQVLRFWNTDVRANIDGVLETIMNACRDEER